MPAIQNDSVTLFSVVGAVAATLTVFGALSAVVRLLAAFYRKTIGRRREDALKIAKLACGVRLHYVNSVLGQPVFRFEQKFSTDGAVNSTEFPWVEYIYVLKEAFVQIRCWPNETVATLAVTTTSTRFHPKIEVPGAGAEAGFDVVLGKTRFAEFPDLPIVSSLVVGARRVRYAEGYYFGNPGYYQNYHLVCNDVSSVGSPRGRAHELIQRHLGESSFDAGNWPDDLTAFRRESAPNTLVVIGPGVDWSELGCPVGVDADLVRVLPMHRQTTARAWRW